MFHFQNNFTVLLFCFFTSSLRMETKMCKCMPLLSLQMNIHYMLSAELVDVKVFLSFFCQYRKLKMTKEFGSKTFVNTLPNEEKFLLLRYVIDANFT